MDKSILDVVHDTAQDLQDAGVMQATTLREFDALCLPPVKEFTALQIKRIRTKNLASHGPSLKLLNLVAKKGLKILA